MSRMNTTMRTAPPPAAMPMMAPMGSPEEGAEVVPVVGVSVVGYVCTCECSVNTEV